MTHYAAVHLGLMVAGLIGMTLLAVLVARYDAQRIPRAAGVAMVVAGVFIGLSTLANTRLNGQPIMDPCSTCDSIGGWVCFLIGCW